MANLRETVELMGLTPSLIATEVLIEADQLPLEDIEGRRELLRFEESQTRQNGGFRYDLLLGQTEAGKSYLSLRVIPSSDRGITYQAYEEAAWSRRTSGGREPLRTGYLDINESEITDLRPVGIFEGTTPAMEDILKLHFPNHKVVIQDIDGYGGNF